MTVGELMIILEKINPDTNVYIRDNEYEDDDSSGYDRMGIVVVKSIPFSSGDKENGVVLDRTFL